MESGTCWTHCADPRTTLEFKRDLSSPEGLLRTVVAFANTAGGIVLVGVEDGMRHVRSVAAPLALEERIASPHHRLDRASATARSRGTELPEDSGDRATAPVPAICARIIW